MEEETESLNFKETVIAVWQSRFFQMGMDFCRVLLIVIAILIAYKLITEIDSVKVLNNDPCQVCMVKTGANCILPNANENGTRPTYGTINFTELIPDEP